MCFFFDNMWWHFSKKYFYNSSTQNFRHIEVTFVEVGQLLILIIIFSYKFVFYITKFPKIFN